MRHHFFCSVLFAASVLAASQTPVEPSDDLLDLLPEAAPRQTSEGPVSRTMRTQGPWYEWMPAFKPLPIKITLLSVDQTSYILGDPATFEVSLENIGPGPLTIPWGAPIDLERINPGPDDPPGFLTATITLSSNEDQVALSVVYGSRLAPRSLRSLKPGERVRVRAQASPQGSRGYPQFRLTASGSASISARGEVFYGLPSAPPSDPPWAAFSDSK